MWHKEPLDVAVVVVVAVVVAVKRHLTETILVENELKCSTAI